MTYEDEFRSCLAAAGVELTGLHTMAAGKYFAQRLAIAKPVPRRSVEPVAERVADTA